MAVGSTLIGFSPLSTVDDVHDGLASYLEALVRADELAGKIEWTDELPDEEIEIVEKAIGK
jgi:hypothetical protein